MNKGTRDLKYFMHYIKHTHYVTLAWKAICTELWDRGMLNEEEFKKTTNLIIWHDQSKMDKDEWEAYAEKFYGDKKTSEVKAAFEIAKNKHKSKNLHHFESLKDYKGNDWKCYIIELVCDYIAMGWEFDNYILEYYESEKENIELPKEYKEYLESILNILREKELFETIESHLDEKKEAELDFLNITLGQKK